MLTVHLGDIFNLGTFLVALGIYRKINIMTYQHKLMWIDFAKHKGIDAKANGASA
jgi:hypothetical protein